MLYRFTGKRTKKILYCTLFIRKKCILLRHKFGIAILAQSVEQRIRNA